MKTGQRWKNQERQCALHSRQRKRERQNHDFALSSQVGKACAAENPSGKREIETEARSQNRTGNRGWRDQPNDEKMIWKSTEEKKTKRTQAEGAKKKIVERKSLAAPEREDWRNIQRGI
jgi:hypothetical protein